MRAPDRDLPTVVAELQRAIAAGHEPNLTRGERAALVAYIRSLQPDRRGQHKSLARHIQGANRRMLQDSMKWLKRKLRNDPAEQELKRTLRRDGDRYVLNRRVAKVMHERLKKSGRKTVPSVKL